MLLRSVALGSRVVRSSTCAISNSASNGVVARMGTRHATSQTQEILQAAVMHQSRQRSSSTLASGLRGAALATSLCGGALFVAVSRNTQRSNTEWRVNNTRMADLRAEHEAYLVSVIESHPCASRSSAVHDWMSRLLRRVMLYASSLGLAVGSLAIYFGSVLPGSLLAVGSAIALTTAIIWTMRVWLEERSRETPQQWEQRVTRLAAQRPFELLPEPVRRVTIEALHEIIATSPTLLEHAIEGIQLVASTWRFAPDGRRATLDVALHAARSRSGDDLMSHVGAADEVDHSHLVIEFADSRGGALSATVQNANVSWISAQRVVSDVGSELVKLRNHMVTAAIVKDAKVVEKCSSTLHSIETIYTAVDSYE